MSATNIAYINHMKRNSQGEDLLEGEEQRFESDIYLDASLAGPASSPLTVILDPGETNQVPPLLP